MTGIKGELIKSRDSKIAEAATPMVDKPYSLGEMDCLISMKMFFSKLGINIPDDFEFEGINKNNYAAFWKKKPKEAKEKLKRFLFSIGREIAPAFFIRGDILIFESKQLPAFPGIYLGNNNVLMVFEEGSRVVPLKMLEHYLIAARRVFE